MPRTTGWGKKLGPRESVIFKGIEFYRYPKSKKLHHRRYFRTARWIGQKPREFLHRAIWESEHGKIPFGHHVHHKDGNCSNNTLENLACVTCQQHHTEHENRGDYDTPARYAALHRAQLAARAWHKTKEGLKWHREHAIRTNFGKTIARVLAKCAGCGIDIQAAFHVKQKYCSDQCRERVRCKIRLTNGGISICKVCKKEFKNSIEQPRKFCSRTCITENCRSRERSRNGFTKRTIGVKRNAAWVRVACSFFSSLGCATLFSRMNWSMLAC